jgi:hypothetical protein
MTDSLFLVFPFGTGQFRIRVLINEQIYLLGTNNLEGKRCRLHRPIRQSLATCLSGDGQWKLGKVVGTAERMFTGFQANRKRGLACGFPFWTIVEVTLMI